MKILRMWYKPEAEIEFTLTEVWALTLFSERHYDYKCRELSMQGGLLRGMRNRFESDTKDATISLCLDGSTVDLLAKCAEKDPSLSGRLVAILKTLNNDYRKLNKLKRRKRKARCTQPTDAGCGMSGIQMGN